VRLNNVRLVPVVEFVPGHFATRSRPLPSGTGREVPDEWDAYWRASLADSGVVGLTPLRPGSWHVPTRQLTGPDTLKTLLRVTLGPWGE
jgi:hypothetical protein